MSIEKDLGSLPPLYANESQLREALTNLVLNAVDAMPEGGLITFRARSDGKWVTLEVSDAGRGMEEDVRRRCFEPFFTTKGPSGTGMGLAVSYGGIRQQGGTMDVKSRLGEGTTFVIRLPVAVPQHMDLDLPEMPEKIATQRILVIDDEIWTRQILARVLTEEGHQVDSAVDGTEGLEKFSADRHDVVITDRAMPDMSGDRVAAEIKLKSPLTPIIMLTGFGGIMQEDGEHPPGVDRLLTKPVTAAGIMEAVASVINGNGSD